MKTPMPMYIQFIYVYPFISPLKELERFKSFGSSLLSKEAKLQDLVTDLEQALEELGKPADSVDGKRVSKYIA